MCLDLYNQAVIGCRKIARVLCVVFKDILEKIPHHTTIRQWIVRNGYYFLHSPLQTANDWVAISDITIDVGKVKCLAIIGVRMCRLEWLGNCTLTHKDVTILGLYPTGKMTGEFAHKAFESARKRVGADFLAVVIDQGSDIKKGARLFQAQCKDTKIIHDITHKLSLVMEWTLKDDPEWIAFTKKLLETRRLIQQTELAAMMPASQRAKGRFMDISYFVEWPGRILLSKQSGYLASIPEERYEKYFGWIKEFELSLRNWEYMIGAVDLINSIFRECGLCHDAHEYIKAFFGEILPTDEVKLNDFTIKVLNTIQEECAKLNKDQVLICMTEVLESLFGKLKEIISGNQGITSNVLGMATFVGPERSEQDIKRVMEECSIKSAWEWIKENLGESLGKLRYRFFYGSKGTNFACTELPAKVA